MATKSTPPVEPDPSEESLPLDLAAVLKRKSTAPIIANGREFAYSKIPYEVKGKRVTREEYVAYQRGLQKQALKEELAAAVAEDLANPPTPPADSATSKE